jgi:hypothetical protein
MKLFCSKPLQTVVPLIEALYQAVHTLYLSIVFRIFMMWSKPKPTFTGIEPPPHRVYAPPARRRRRVRHTTTMVEGVVVHEAIILKADTMNKNKKRIKLIVY